MENRKIKKMTMFIAIFITLGAILNSPSVVRGDSSSQPENQKIANETSSTTGSIFIPCIFNKFCSSPTVSPFSIQIAGLSDFVQTSGMTDIEFEKMKASQISAYDSAFPTMVEAVKESGAGWARVYIDWSIIQTIDPASGSVTYNWANYDNWLGQVTSANVQIIATISNPPIWAAVDKSSDLSCTNMIKEEKIGDFYNFIDALVARYKASPYNVHVWEILNEPDAIDGYRCNTGVSNYGDHGQEYAELIQGAYQRIKASDPYSKVIMGGLAYDSFYLSEVDKQYYDGSPLGMFNRYFVDNVFTNGAASYLDGVNFHYFNDFSAEWQRWTVGDDSLPTCGNIRTPNGTTYIPEGLDLVAKGTHFLNRLSVCFNVNKPLWITEVGMHGIDPTSPYYYYNETLKNRYSSGQSLENQARYVFKVYARGLSLGAETITWYAIKIIPNVTPDDYQGLLFDSRDGIKENQPKPAYFAYQTLAGELSGYSFSETLLSSISAEAYSFTNFCQEKKIIGWSNQPQSIPYSISNASTIKLKYRPQAINVQDTLIRDGDSNDLDHVVNGNIVIPLGEEPVIIQVNP